MAAHLGLEQLRNGDIRGLAPPDTPLPARAARAVSPSEQDVQERAARGDLAQDLPEAVERDEIVPFFQPLVELATGRIIAFEALARWPRSDGRIIPPAEFIPLAEKSGVIGGLSERLLRRACLAAAHWPRDIQLCVNVSPLQLCNPAAAERLSRVAEQAGLPLSRITFEITEGAIVEDFEVARRILGDLKARGARLSLDDFGTGYSGLLRLQMLPFDTLKIDAAFVRDMTTHRLSRMIVWAVMGLCRKSRPGIRCRRHRNP